MKTLLTALVLVLALGTVATKTVYVAKTSAMPTPMCPPDDPNACGFR